MPVHLIVYVQYFVSLTVNIATLFIFFRESYSFSTFKFSLPLTETSTGRPLINTSDKSMHAVNLCGAPRYKLQNTTIGRPHNWKRINCNIVTGEYIL